MHVADARSHHRDGDGAGQRRGSEEGRGRGIGHEDEESDTASDVEVKSETERSFQQSKNDAVSPVTNKNCDDSDNMEDKVMKEEGSSESKPEANDDNGDSEANNKDSKGNNEDSQEIKSVNEIEGKGSQPEKEDLTR